MSKSRNTALNTPLSVSDRHIEAPNIRGFIPATFCYLINGTSQDCGTSQV